MVILGYRLQLDKGRTLFYLKLNKIWVGEFPPAVREESDLGAGGSEVVHPTQEVLETISSIQCRVTGGYQSID